MNIYTRFIRCVTSEPGHEGAESVPDFLQWWTIAGNSAAVPSAATYGNISRCRWSDTADPSAGPSKASICHRLNFLGTTLLSLYSLKLYELRIVR